ncbi:hypothetical protein BIFGAL_04087 [Bifidobacterium gallicum DSM 20093 = LMG 11596]|uniref:Uncharacterized protein n=1 Tax=Bifidobacterium gallicum DSM 20093 = LMG 11596 TaxID=561180 RepID=D1NW42_9BIFI|nr:hypothetical protein BIFGAL_04087 [Bifidobacterium gallicum DSM 20093 = LMG 11596]
MLCAAHVCCARQTVPPIRFRAPDVSGPPAVRRACTPFQYPPSNRKSCVGDRRLPAQREYSPEIRRALHNTPLTLDTPPSFAAMENHAKSLKTR